MANEEHLEILKQGVEVWNRWRVENPHIIPDLSDVNLSEVYIDRKSLIGVIPFEELHQGFDLSSVDFFKVNLSGANFSGTIFRRTKLREAILKLTVFSEADLSEADLSDTDLEQADFSSAYLYKADLSRAVLTGTEFIGADLSESYFFKANLSEGNLLGANLSGANFSDADLSRAILNRSQLIRTNLTGANLDEANLSKAKMGYTILEYVDLRGVQGLDAIVHLGPSVIGINTLHISRGNLSENFLIAAGVPRSFLSYIRLQAEQSPHYSSCFISYSSKDEAFAHQLHSDLQEKSVRCWFAPEDMKIGDVIPQRIEEAIKIHDKLLLVLSEYSINSTWVEREVATALEEESKRKEIVLFPIRLDETVKKSNQAWAADIRRTRHIGDFSRWKDHDAYQQAFERLLRDLKAEG